MGAKPSSELSDDSDRDRTFSSSNSSDLGAGFNILRSLQNVNLNNVDSQSSNGTDEEGSTLETDPTSGGGGGVGSGGGTLESGMAAINASNFSLARVYAATHSLPSHICSWANGIKCPVCSKFVTPDDIECHLLLCLTKPRLIYNEDVLTDDKGECVICLDDLSQGDTIARLPCLCIYHKTCIDEWFEVNRSCPEHPGD